MKMDVETCFNQTGSYKIPNTESRYVMIHVKVEPT